MVEKMMRRQSKSFKVALEVLSHDELDDIAAKTGGGAKDLIAKFNTMIQEKNKAAKALGQEHRNSDDEQKKLHELAALIAERRKQGVRRPSADVETTKQPEMLDVKLKKVEIAEKPVRQESSLLPKVKLQHIVDNTGNIEYEEFLEEEGSFKGDVNSELRPSTMKFLRSISARETIEFMQKYEDDWQERLQALLEADGDLVPVNDGEYEEGSSKKQP